MQTLSIYTCTCISYTQRILLSIMPYSFYHDHLEGSPSPYEFILNIIFSRTISRSSVKKEDLNNSQRHKNYLHDVHLIMNNLNVSTLIVFLELIVFFWTESALLLITRKRNKRNISSYLNMWQCLHWNSTIKLYRLHKSSPIEWRLYEQWLINTSQQQHYIIIYVWLYKYIRPVRVKL